MPLSIPSMTRRSALRWGGALAAVASVPHGLSLAQAADDFIRGPAVPDYPIKSVSRRVAMVWTPDGFPTPENRGMMANVTFVFTSVGVVVVDAGASVQIGEMAIRRLRTLSNQPVVAIINTHYHGDHFLGNHAFVNAFGKDLPIYAHPGTRAQIAGVAGSSWRTMMERWTNGASLGTEVIPPNHDAGHGTELRFGDTTLRLHHHGVAHTEADLCVEVVEDHLVCVGDVAMDHRIANLDDGSYLGTLRTFEALERDTRAQLWAPAHGLASAELLRNQRELFEGIYRVCEQAVKEGASLEVAKPRVLADPRVAKYAANTQGWASNIGKYTSIAYLEAEKEAF